MGSGGVTATGGPHGFGASGAGGGGGLPGSGAMGGTSGTAGSRGVFGMPCAINQDCPSGSICCDGSSESCNGTRLPSGDGVDPGEFVVSADGLTATDAVSGLIWQRDGSGTRTGCIGVGNTCAWADAQAYCASLVLGGLSGWRLPGYRELSTIVDFTRVDPSIDPTAFPNTPKEWFWTFGPYKGMPLPSPPYAWHVNFGMGNATAEPEYDSDRLRCVHEALHCYPAIRFVSLDGGMVSDAITQLVWQQPTNGWTMPWADAKTSCSSVGFRLPTVKELISLVDPTLSSGPTINQSAFPGTMPAGYWTSTPYAGDSGNAWMVYFYAGSFGPDDINNANAALCVR